MAIALITSGSAGTSTSTSQYIVQTTVAIPAGSLIVIGVGSDAPTGSTNAFVTITDSSSNAYTRSNEAFLLNSYYSGMFYAFNSNATASGTNIQINFAVASGMHSMWYAAFSGVATTAPLDVLANNPNVDGAAPSSTIYTSGASPTTNQPNELLISQTILFADISAEADTVGGTGTWTLIAKQGISPAGSPAGSNRSSFGQYQIVNAAGSYVAAPSGSTHNFATNFASFKNANSGLAPALRSLMLLGIGS